MPVKSKKRKPAKPAKPYADFPLFPHATKRWAKKIRGRLHYFGSTTTDPKGAAALERFNREWPYLSTGRVPPQTVDGGACTIKELCDAFMTSKTRKMESGELSADSWRGYYNTCQRIVDHFGKDRRVDDLTPVDFEGFRAVLAKRRGKVTLKNEVNRSRMVFKYAFDQQLIDRPVRYGQSFDRPSGKAMRKARNESVQRFLEREELLAILDHADSVMRAMVLLGLNTGFGNKDIANLPQSAIDLDGGWVTFPRTKTEIMRRVPLWPETVKALRDAIAERPEPSDAADGDLCFITAYGNRYVRTTPSATTPGKFTTVNSVSTGFKAVMKRAGVNKPGVSFYSLRHVFETIGGESKDQVAVDAAMGHAPKAGDMAWVYRHGISEDRLRSVVETVRRWLWGNVS